MKFDDAVKIILRSEGYYSDHAKDPGGKTKYGISKKAYPDLDIKTLTKEQAISIYKRDYWNSIKLSEFPASLRLVVFDGAVNQGVRTTIRRLQHSISVEVDGIVGPVTLKALRECNAIEVRNNFIMRRYYSYSKLLGWETFGKGWCKRLLEVALHSNV